MNTYIALLRGINVGGHNKLPMRELVALLERLGLHNIKTYIQSGNVVFQSERTDRSTLSAEITAAIGDSHGFTPQIFLLDIAELQAAVVANPFPEGEAEPKTLHLFFLDGIPQAVDWEAFGQRKIESERFKLINHVFYVHAPDGIGRSKLVENIGKGWSVGITARNWRTVNKVLTLAQDIAAG